MAKVLSRSDLLSAGVHREITIGTNNYYLDHTQILNQYALNHTVCPKNIQSFTRELLTAPDNQLTTHAIKPSRISHPSLHLIVGFTAPIMFTKSDISLRPQNGLRIQIIKL
jgi:hypothetical protein